MNSVISSLRADHCKEKYSCEKPCQSSKEKVDASGQKRRLYVSCSVLGNNVISLAMRAALTSGEKSEDVSEDGERECDQIFSSQGVADRWVRRQDFSMKG
jgi:hypothetical protein